jgi:hypothetical protein
MVHDSQKDVVDRVPVKSSYRVLHIGELGLGGSEKSLARWVLANYPNFL